jgi:tetratricopeptide (TPR) repeat protein
MCRHGFSLFSMLMSLSFCGQLTGCSYQIKLLELNQSLIVNPENTQALYNRATLYYEMGDNQDAITDLILLSKLEPNDPGAHAKLGIIYRSIEDKQKAIQHFEFASTIALKNGDKDAYESFKRDVYILKQQR